MLAVSILLCCWAGMFTVSWNSCLTDKSIWAGKMNINAEHIISFGKIAGIAGICLGVMLIIFRGIIKKDIFPKFKNETLSYKILRLVIFLTWTIAVFGIAVWTYSKINKYPTTAIGKQQKWDIVKVSERITSKYVNNSKCTIKYPHIDGLSDKANEPKINSKLKRIALDFIDKYKGFSELYVKYKIRYNEYNLLGIRYDVMLENKGAAHPLYQSIGVNVNLLNGELFEFKDLFRSGFKNKINALVIASLKRNKMYFPCKKTINKKINQAVSKILNIDMAVCFNSVKDDSEFYVTDVSVVVVFPQYSIAPGANGVIEVVLKFDLISNLVNLNGPLQMFFH